MKAGHFLQALTNRSTRSLILIFIVLDLLTAFCYGLYLNDVLDSRFFRLGRDRGLFELIEYIKFAGIIYLFHLAWQQTRAPIMKAWSILFLVMLVDNALGLHEAFGELLAEFLPLPDIGLSRPKDLGEIIMLGLMEGNALLYVIHQYFQSEKTYRQFSLGLISLVVFLGAGSVLFDALHLAMFEEPFEILGMTTLLGFVHFRYRRDEQASN